MVHKQFIRSNKIIEVRLGSTYINYDPFVLAQKCRQVSFLHYPSLIKSKLNWLAIVKTKSIGRIEMDESLEVAYQNDVYSHT